ncbi:MAG: PqqD family protein [Candidatus Magnetomorum sp.]|nr:PqqD family protein [Candidatus Magnetomorum sp.]
MPDTLISQELNDELMLYKTDSEEIHVLNPTARRIYDLYQQGKTTDEIISILNKTFQIHETHPLKEDIETCIAQLKLKNIL